MKFPSVMFVLVFVSLPFEIVSIIATDCEQRHGRLEVKHICHLENLVFSFETL